MWVCMVINVMVITVCQNVRLYSKKIYRLYFLSALKRLKKFSEMRKLNLLKRVINVENRED